MRYVIALSLILAPSAGLAQTTTTDRLPTLRPGEDPNQIVCMRQREIGTRIVIRRDCMTRAEWAEHRRLTRENVDRAQLTRVIGAK